MEAFLFSGREMEEMKIKLIKKPEKVKSDLTVKFIPSLDDLEKYNFILNKESLNKVFIEKRTLPSEVFNLGVPQYLLTTVCKFNKKSQSDLSVLDLYILSKSFHNLFQEKINSLNLKKFSRANKLYFGISQYLLMEEYLNNFNS